MLNNNHHNSEEKPEITPEDSPLKFPGDMEIKVVGIDQGQFQEFVLTTIRQQLPANPQLTVRSRPSSGNKYLAVTIGFWADTRAQWDAIVAALSADPRVKLVV
jgi:uncharacterized protein